MSFSEDFKNAGADTNTWDEEPNHELAEPTTEYGEVMSAMNSPDTESDSDNSEWSAGMAPVESWEKQADVESEKESENEEEVKELESKLVFIRENRASRVITNAFRAKKNTWQVASSQKKKTSEPTTQEHHVRSELSDEQKKKMKLRAGTQLCKYRRDVDGNLCKNPSDIAEKCDHTIHGQTCFFALNLKDLKPSTSIPCRDPVNCLFGKNCKFFHPENPEATEPEKPKSPEKPAQTVANFPPLKKTQKPTPTHRRESPAFWKAVHDGLQKQKRAPAPKPIKDPSEELRQILGIGSSTEKTGSISISGFDQYTTMNLVSILKREGVKNININF